jgi:tRNA A37 threonylcarbamoyladenosine synthetase subunit TsaC/SUA5/YrdC
VRAAFKFLTELAVAGAGGQTTAFRLPDNPTAFTIARTLDSAMPAHTGSSEYAALAKAAATDAIANWYAQNARQPSLFGTAEQNSEI